MSALSTCDGCNKDRRDVQSCGRDSNGDPDAPDLCFLCRQEWKRRRVYSARHARYIDAETLAYEEERNA